MCNTYYKSYLMVVIWRKNKCQLIFQLGDHFSFHHRHGPIPTGLSGLCRLRSLGFWFQGKLVYEVVGELAAPSFFWVNDKGQVFVRTSLKNDIATFYTVSMPLTIDPWPGHSPYCCEEVHHCCTIHGGGLWVRTPVCQLRGSTVSHFKTWTLSLTHCRCLL